MSDERVYQVQMDGAAPASPLRLSEAGFKERDDLQEWVLAHPEIIGDDVLIIASEFDRWQTGRGDRHASRLDVLGLDSDGRLVLAELKRDLAPESVQLQAITYAAMVASMTEEDIVGALTSRHRRDGVDITDSEAEQMILRHCGALDPEILRSPRIVLVAGDFSPVTTASSLWLSEQGLDITLQRVQAYRIPSGETIVTVSQVFPLPVADELRISPRRTETQKTAERAKRRRETDAVSKIVEAQSLPDGAELRLVPTNEVAQDVRDQIQEWLTAHPAAARAVWVNERSAPIQWEADGQRYKPTTIVRQILEEAAGSQRSIAGPRWWQTVDGRSLSEIAGFIGSPGFDWSVLHDILRNVPGGRWTSYGDLASVIGTAAQPLGRHVAECGQCEHAWRILDARGESSPQFTWNDVTRTGSQQSVLEQEGVHFSLDGRASADQRLTAEEIMELLES